MNEKRIFTRGKHVGKTIEWVQENEPSYLVWLEENNSKFETNMTKLPESEELKHVVKFRDKPISAIRPNENFYNEGPE